MKAKHECCRHCAYAVPHPDDHCVHKVRKQLKEAQAEINNLKTKINQMKDEARCCKKCGQNYEACNYCL